jgi:plasmid maintenance system killer protein
MEIIFKTRKLQKVCNDHKLLVRRYGPRRAKLIRRRLDDLHAADVLADISSLPQARCHQLIDDREGQLSVDLDHPYRLVFEPANDPLPVKPDGGLDWTKVTVVMIIDVEDTHG